MEAILSGNALPTRIFGGRPPDSRLDRIDWTDVNRIDVAVHLSVRGEDLDHLWGPALVALLVSPRSGGSFLGYERRSVGAPALIARYLRWRHRGAFLVRWADVRRIGDGRVEVRDGYRKFAPALP